MKKIISIIFSLLILFGTVRFADARSGCCSHHGGVCGCGCCDGTSLSATCAPYYPECNIIEDPLPEPVCPDRTHLIGESCYCDEGYELNSATHECLTPDESCTKLHGPSVYRSLKSGGAYCECLPGYEDKSVPYYDSIEGQTTNLICVKITEMTAVAETTCPSNSNLLNGVCECDDDFIMNNGKCISHTDNCKLFYGENVSGTKNTESLVNNSNCTCDSGYKWNETETKCISLNYLYPNPPNSGSLGTSIAKPLEIKDNISSLWMLLFIPVAMAITGAIISGFISDNN